MPAPPLYRLLDAEVGHLVLLQYDTHNNSRTPQTDWRLVLVVRTYAASPAYAYFEQKRRFYGVELLHRELRARPGQAGATTVIISGNGGRRIKDGKRHKKMWYHSRVGAAKTAALAPGDARGRAVVQAALLDAR